MRSNWLPARVKGAVDSQPHAEPIHGGWGLGFSVYGLGFRVLGLGFRRASRNVGCRDCCEGYLTDYCGGPFLHSLLSTSKFESLTDRGDRARSIAGRLLEISGASDDQRTTRVTITIYLTEDLIRNKGNILYAVYRTKFPTNNQ